MGRRHREWLAVLVLIPACRAQEGISLEPWNADLAGPGDVEAPDPAPPPDDTSGGDFREDPGTPCPAPGCPPGSICIDGGCVAGCLEDQDCPANQHCLPESLPHGYCAECLEDAHCWTGRCLEGQCRVACNTQEDCATLADAPVCDPINRVCIGCIDTKDCEPGQRCVARTCVAGCVGDSDCPKPLVCDPDEGPLGTCVPCTTDAHCAEGRRCLDHRCVFDCAAVTCPFDRPRCNPETGVCVECLDSSHCPVPLACLAGTRVAGCLQDLDCGEGLVCTGGNPGRCVECRTAGDCAGGAACILEQCVENPCSQDAECGPGRYCHPNLRTCFDLPPRSCSQDRDCGLIPGTQVGRNCDPLTRTCIAECLPGNFCLDSRMFCIDGSCYGCRADPDCPGTRCDPFDRSCRQCTQDGDCLQAGWHCDTASGACVPCVLDVHCGPGGRCHPEKHRCVECMIDADCREPTRPSCAKDNTCVARCSDECMAGREPCAALPDGSSGRRPCGDYDADPCLEPGPVAACPPGQSCVDQGGVGVCACANECQAGESRCRPEDPSVHEVCLADPQTGCPYWVGDTCPAGAACSQGVCACTGECTYPSSKCDPKDITAYYYCGREGGPCLHWIHLRCDRGALCDSRTGYCTDVFQ